MTASVMGCLLTIPALCMASAPQAERKIANKPFDSRRALGQTVALGVYAPIGRLPGFRVDPYRIAFGLGYSWRLPVGISFGVRGQMFLGRTITQQYRPPLQSRQVVLHVDSQLSSISGSLGFDQRLDPFVVSYGIDLGISIFQRDVLNSSIETSSGLPHRSAKVSGVHLSSGIGVVIPLNDYFVGIETRYRIEFVKRVPDALGLSLLTGWRF